MAIHVILSKKPSCSLAAVPLQSEEADPDDPSSPSECWLPHSSAPSSPGMAVGSLQQACHVLGTVESPGWYHIKLDGVHNICHPGALGWITVILRSPTVQSQESPDKNTVLNNVCGMLQEKCALCFGTSSFCTSTHTLWGPPSHLIVYKEFWQCLLWSCWKEEHLGGLAHRRC